jgi:hypothetical protein
MGLQMRFSRNIKWLAIVSIFCTASAAFADGPVNAAVTRLSQVKTFAFGGVGFAGTISKGEIDFKLIVAQPKATALNAFETLYAIGNPQGKSYALAGFKKLHPHRFNELTASMPQSSAQVVVMRGCIVSHEALRYVTKQIDQGGFVF